MRMKRNLWPALMLLGLGAATWPAWRWYVLRITDGSDEPWGVLALLTMLALRMRAGWGAGLRESHFLLPALLLAGYAAAYPFLVPLLRAVVAMGAFGLLLLRGQGASGLWGLLGLHLLSLPIMATLQFYLGSPLRILAAQASATLLRLCGFGVVREGTLLHWKGETVMMDVPCSGVHMLWAGLFLAMTLAALYRCNAIRTALAAGAASGIVIGANVLRATALFFKEAHLVSLPEWTHAGIGLLVFGAGAWAILLLMERLQPRVCA